MVEYDRQNLGVGVWANTPLTNKVPGQSDPEVDPYAWYRWPISEAVSLQPGATVYLFPRAEPANGFYRATVEPNLAVNVTTHGVTFTPKIYYDVALRGPTYELNAAYALPLKEIGSELDFYAAVGEYTWDASVARSQPRTRARGRYGSFTATLPFQISARSKIVASIGYVAGWDATLRAGGGPRVSNALAARRVVATLGYAVTF